nr:hypothetical protein TorRG33x02_018220 [Ipomoea batatas]
MTVDHMNPLRYPHYYKKFQFLSEYSIRHSHHYKKLFRFRSEYSFQYPHHSFGIPTTTVRSGFCFFRVIVASGIPTTVRREFCFFLVIAFGISTTVKSGFCFFLVIAAFGIPTTTVRSGFCFRGEETWVPSFGLVLGNYGVKFGFNGGWEGVEVVRKVESEIGEIQGGVFSPEFIRRLVVSHGSFFGGVEGSQPEPGSVLGKSDFCNPFSPMSLPHSPVKLRQLQWRPRLLHRHWFSTQIAQTGWGCLVVLKLDLKDL